ncbi:MULTISPECIES: hypothetical protein [unclassified Mesorhizobium]|uniref:hypothetical protein n=1 Tax=unclassified Mesorhizobium TaxID=325217 RepID=UPI000FC9A864|nr:MULTISPECIES: hypothetical protein [unclassified Mesorhizobium]TGP29093.1 hypothetical protein EN875_030230 [Mesorhizobium sp. M2D.F.Ca.ET.232.01.1.1]TGQ44065.1 hypothetical protein EN863_014545 [Mesorhizobium sp. M00.F.Ca.ET.220.01.1.1]TGT95018.1 hypothetical protein EN806_54185 [bacterium M00.F.Ca.ET.163.01.1.1]
MSDMVERVAKAIEPSLLGVFTAGMRKAVAREIARAAIEAMREPTPEIIQAWLAFYEVRNEPKHMTKRAITIWHTLISAALSQSQSPNTADTTSTAGDSK